MGNFPSIGMFPLEGTIFPYGFHNIIPESLRPHWLYYPKTNIPLPHFGMDWGNYPIYPLGMKAIPSRNFTTLNRQIYKAIVELDFDKLEKILDSGKFDYTNEIVEPTSGLTAIGMASALNLIEIVHYLAKRGVDFEHRIGPYQKTALHIAIENGNELVAKYLLNNGANIHAKDAFGLDVYDKIEFRALYHFKDFLDYFKENPKNREVVDFEEFRYTSELILEDFDTITFKPSNLLEVSVNNKLTPISENEKISLDKFELFMFNQYELNNLESSNPNKVKRAYDNLNYIYNKV